jgi:putative membrane protein
MDGGRAVRRGAWVAFGVLALATWWRPHWPAEQALHHSLTGCALVALAWLDRRRRLPTSSLVLVLTFLALHTVAARWIYSYVPYDDWTRALFGVDLSEAFGWRRNHFDRLVHLAYGMCFGPVLLRHLMDARGWPPVRAGLASVEAVLSTSALYELFEWAVAMVLAPSAAEAYNGQQGDGWDAHKDMALATGGAALVVGLLVARAVLTARRPTARRR